jgi:hypothetical protein
VTTEMVKPHAVVHYANDKVPALGDIVLHTSTQTHEVTVGIIVGLNSAAAQMMPLARRYSLGAQFYPVALPASTRPDYVSLAECWLVDVEMRKVAA